MKIIEANENTIIFKGFGKGMDGAELSNYELTIFLNNESLEKCVFHYLREKVDFEFYK